MGKSYSKTEEKEVFITQNSSGGGNSATEYEGEYHVKLNNMLISFLLALMVLIIIIIIYLKTKKTYKEWIGRQMDKAFVRRMRLRLSGRAERARPGIPEEDV